MNDFRCAAFGLAVVLLGGCAAIPRAGDAGPALAAFEGLPTEARVRAGPGAGDFAARVAGLLPDAIRQVEQRHGRAFRQPVRVFVCATAACFGTLVPRPPGLTAAVAFDNRLILAPRLFDREPHRLRPVLVHELSHLHFGQSLGHYTPTIPVWFHEGFASWVADGGGADLLTDAQAFAGAPTPESIGLDEPIAARPLLRRALDRRPDLRAYRLWYLFVDWMARDRPGNLAWLVDQLQDGEPFDRTFFDAFGQSPVELFRAFVAGHAHAGEPGR